MTPAEKEARNRRNYKYAFFAMGAFFLISVCCICCIRKKIALLIAVLKAAAKFIFDVKTSLCVPPVFYFMYIGYFCWWFISALFIYTTGELDENATLPFG